MNVAVISGRIATEIELKATPTGVAVCSFNVAVKRDYKNSNGEYDADFITCVAWRNQAEFISKYFAKGQQIEIKGRTEVRTWDDAEGNRRTKSEIIVEGVGFLGKKESNPTVTPSTVLSAPEINTDGLDANDLNNDDDLPF